MSENSSSAKQPASGRLADKVALVVGAGSRGEGMSNGRATAILFAREGAKVVCADLNADSSATTVGMIEAEGGVALSVAGDVSDPASAANMVEATVREFGRIDILHNNVGIAVRSVRLWMSTSKSSGGIWRSTWKEPCLPCGRLYRICSNRAVVPSSTYRR